MKRAHWQPYDQRLLQEVDDLEGLMNELLERSTILNVDPNRGRGKVFFVGFPRFGWGPSDETQLRLQMRGLEMFETLRVRVGLLFASPTPSVRSRLDDAFDFLRAWLERSGGDHSIPPSLAEAKEKLAAQVEELRTLVRLATTADTARRDIVALPDTNAILDNPDFRSYGEVLGTKRYEVRLLPTVVGELDDLKRAGRTDQVREGARRADRVLKGLRDRGDVRTGVPVTSTATAVFEVVEPRFDKLPSWLDPSVPDDRIVASALLVQSATPSAVVMLVTSDLNMQNKAAALGLPWVDPPPAPKKR